MGYVPAIFCYYSPWIRFPQKDLCPSLRPSLLFRGEEAPLIILPDVDKRLEDSAMTIGEQ